MENNKVNLLNEKNVSGFSFFFMITVYVFISFFGQLLAGVLFSGTAYLVVCSTFSSIAMAGVLAVLILKRKENVFNCLKLKAFKFKYLVLSVAISFGMLFGLGFINDAVIKLFNKIGISVSDVFIPLSSPLHLIVFSIVLALIPAVFEECFFRGFMLGKLQNVKSAFAILSVSVCFALYHKSVAQFLYQVIYGALLCLLFKRSGSVIPCMVAHFLNNFSVLCFEYFKISIDLYNPLLIAVGLVVLVITTSLLVFNECKENRGKEKKGQIRDFWLPFALFGAVICSVFIVGNLFGV